MENIKHQGLLTINVLKEQVEKGLIEGDSVLTIEINGEQVIVGSLDVAMGRFSGGRSQNIIVLHPKEEPEEMAKSDMPSASPVTEGIDYKKIEELSNQISCLLQNEPSKEIVVALCFSIARVMYKCIPNSDDFIPHISDLVRYFYSSNREVEPKNEQ